MFVQCTGISMLEVCYIQNDAQYSTTYCPFNFNNQQDKSQLNQP